MKLLLSKFVSLKELRAILITEILPKVRGYLADISINCHLVLRINLAIYHYVSHLTKRFAVFILPYFE